MPDRLESWKEIAAYLGRTVRTVQRWTQGRGLPVRHLPGGGRPRVYAHESEIEAWLRVDVPEPRPQTVAVLPFQYLSGLAEERCFGDGLADDLINALARLPGLLVTARTSSFACAQLGLDAPAAGARLGAAWLIEGSVRSYGESLRVVARLVETRTGYQAWSEVFDRRLGDVLAVQDEIARAIAAALRLTLALPPRAAARPDLQAYDLWVQGRSLGQRFTPEAFARARACFETAIARDAAFARSQFGLAELLFLGVQFGLISAPDAPARPARRSARTELDEGCGEAQALKGVLLGLFQHDWAAAESAFRRALELAPGSASVHIHYAWHHLVPRLRLVEAHEEARLAVALDPLSPFTQARLGLVRLAARQYGPALESCRAALLLAPRLWPLHWFHATALLMHGREAEGLREARRICQQVRQPLVVGALPPRPAEEEEGAPAPAERKPAPAAPAARPRRGAATGERRGRRPRGATRRTHRREPLTTRAADPRFQAAAKMNPKPAGRGDGRGGDRAHGGATRPRGEGGPRAGGGKKTGGGEGEDGGALLYGLCGKKRKARSSWPSWNRPGPPRPAAAGGGRRRAAGGRQRAPDPAARPRPTRRRCTRRGRRAPGPPGLRAAGAAEPRDAPQPEPTPGAPSPATRRPRAPPRGRPARQARHARGARGGGRRRRGRQQGGGEATAGALVGEVHHVDALVADAGADVARDALLLLGQDAEAREARVDVHQRGQRDRRSGTRRGREYQK